MVASIKLRLSKTVRQSSTQLLKTPGFPHLLKQKKSYIGENETNKKRFGSPKSVRQSSTQLF